MQTFSNLMQVNDTIEHVSPEEAHDKWKNQQAIFIDVRSKEGFESGHIDGALHLNRGMLEFYLAEGSPLENPVFKENPDALFIVYCDKGGQSALSTKTMQDMGVKNVVNMRGGFTAWQEIAS